MKVKRQSQGIREAEDMQRNPDNNQTMKVPLPVFAAQI